jgi:hypothetical protein
MIVIRKKNRIGRFSILQGGDARLGPAKLNTTAGAPTGQTHKQIIGQRIVIGGTAVFMLSLRISILLRMALIPPPTNEYPSQI